MFGWERTDGSGGRSAARVEELADGWLLHGCEVLVGHETLACWFTVRVGSDWSTREVEVAAFSAAGRRQVSLAVDHTDGWSVWSVNGVPDGRLDDCIDVDVAATPLTNTFPIRRLAALEVGAAATRPVAWVDVPSLTVTRVEQTYERLAGRNGLDAWRYSDPIHGAFVLEVDGDGFVVDYERFARRVRP